MKIKSRKKVDDGRIARIRNEFGRALIAWKFRGIPDRMVSISEALRSSAGDEEKFLEMGRTLQTVYVDTTEMIRYFKDSIEEVMGGDGSNILNMAGSIAKRAESALTRRQERVMANLGKIRDVADHLGLLHQACDDLGGIAMNLRVVGLNIGVESTRSREGLEMFTVVSQEILKLSEKVDDIARRIREDATAAMSQQMQAFEAISGGLKELSNLSADAAHVVEDAVGETENVIGVFLKAFETADERFKEVSNRVGEIVMGIQFHDNMRQRLEHITDAMDDSGQILRGRFPKPAQIDRGVVEEASSDLGSGKEALGRACSVVALQKIQLEDVIAEIRRVHGESSAAFGEIDGKMAEIGGVISAVGGDFQGVDGGGEDPFIKLTAAFTGLSELLERGDELGGRIEESVSRVSEIGRRFSDHLSDVDAISFETKIKALNAIVKAGHMSGDGRTLEVLAQEMNRLSEQTNGFVGNVEGKLQEVGEFENRILRIEADIQGDEGSGADISEILTNGIDEIVRIRELMDGRVEKAVEKAGILRGEISRTVSELGFLTDLADEMSVHLETMNDVTCRLSPTMERWKRDGVSGEETLSGRYTMHRERMLHDAVFSSGDGASEKNEAFPDDTAGADDDISLWGDDADENGPGDEDISLWGGDEDVAGGNDRKEVGDPSLKKDAAGEFGHIIELF